MNKLAIFDQFALGKLVSDKRSNRCVIYTRVSTKEQADNNLSLETQKKAAELYAQKHGFAIMGCFGGTYESAKTDERKEFNNMLTFVKKVKEKISYIIVYSVDRFSRSGANAIYIAEQLKKQGISIIAITKPADTTTASGSLQQNIQFIFSEYDNQLRRQKCIAGIKEKLMQGEWIQGIPFGYDNIKKNGKRCIVVNANGKLLKKAFQWKAEEKISNETVRQRLAGLGLKLTYQHISRILKNPFYCGLIAHNVLEGSVVQGKHEKLISEELFLKVNEVQNANHHGYKQTVENDRLPLKRFLKCDHCGSYMRGYIVKQKDIPYYKCNTKGCKNNKNAKLMDDAFADELNLYALDQVLKPLLKKQMIATYNQLNKSNDENQESLNKQLAEVTRKLERLEERFVLEEITKEQFDKFQIRFTKERTEIEKELGKSPITGSNLEQCVDYAIDFGMKLPSLWASSTYTQKQQLQFLVFPKGIRYNKKTGGCRTEEVNTAFEDILLLSRDLGGGKKQERGIIPLNVHSVVPSRIELLSKV